MFSFNFCVDRRLGCAFAEGSGNASPFCRLRHKAPGPKNPRETRRMSVRNKGAPVGLKEEPPELAGKVKAWNLVDNVHLCLSLINNPPQNE